MKLNNVSTIKENTEHLLHASKEGGLDYTQEKKSLSHYQNGGQNHNINTANKSFENVAKRGTNQNHIHKEMKSRLNLGNACYHSLQILFTFPPAI
jgi:uncharacterized membrane protein YccC